MNCIKGEYERIQVFPFQFTSISEMKIQNEPGKHPYAHVKGVISEKAESKYVKSTDEETQAQIAYVDGDNEINIFCGIVSSIQTKAEGSLYTMELTLRGMTTRMDVTKRKRDFQKLSMTTHQLIADVMSSYPSADYEINIPNEAIGSFLLQYNETDYEFLKRILSNYHKSLFCDVRYSSAKLYFGEPNLSITPGEEFEDYAVRKNLKKYKQASNNDASDIDEKDYYTYEIKSEEIYHVGEKFQFLNQTLYVKKSQYRIQNGYLYNIYDLVPKAGLRTTKKYNKRIIGISINGKIMKVTRDQVKVKLDINPGQKELDACFFPYASVASSPDGSGWYCMPEVGEKIRLNCPTKKESEAFVVSNIDSQGMSGGGSSTSGGSTDRMSSPENKSLKTDAGQEVKFTPSGALIACEGNASSIALNKDGSIEVNAENAIQFSCGKMLSIRAEGAITVNAKESIDLMSDGGGELKFKGSKIELKGNKIMNNGN